MRIKRSIDFHVCGEFQRRKLKLLGNNEDVFQNFRAALNHGLAVEQSLAALRTQQSTHQIEQRAFARAVFTEKPVDAVGLEIHAEMAEHRIAPALVAKSDVIKLYHII